VEVEVSNGHFWERWDEMFFSARTMALMDYRWFCYPLTITINYFFYQLTIGLNGFSMVLGSFNHRHLMIFGPKTIAWLDGFSMVFRF